MKLRVLVLIMYSQLRDLWNDKRKIVSDEPDIINDNRNVQ
jgi:hypothetical protein